MSGVRTHPVVQLLSLERQEAEEISPSEVRGHLSRLSQRKEHLHNGGTVHLSIIPTSYALAHLISFSTRHSRLAWINEIIEVWGYYGNAQDGFHDGGMELLHYMTIH